MHSNSPDQRRSRLSKALAVVAACVGYLTVSSGLILINKYLLSTDGFAYPMTLSALGQLFSALASFLLCKVLRVVDTKQTMSTRLFALNIMPVGIFTALTLWLGNMVYLHLSVALIQMLKAVCPVMVMIALFLARLEQPTKPLIVSVLVICIGTVIASAGQVNLSLLGITIMLLSEAAEAARLAMTQYLLSGLSFHPIEGLMYFGAASSMWMSIGIVFTELPEMRRNNAFDKVLAAPHMYVLAGSMGFAVSLLSYCIIQLSSSLTLKVLGTARNAGLVVFSTIFLGDIVSALQFVGYSISLAGFGWYNAIKAGYGKPQSPKAMHGKDAHNHSTVPLLVETNGRNGNSERQSLLLGQPKSVRD